MNEYLHAQADFYVKWPELYPFNPERLPEEER